MVELKKLKYKYSKDYREVFEDIATQMFCIDLKLSGGVNRRVNQKAIESDPVFKNGKCYAYQAKYYEESTKLYQHKKDLIESIKFASEEGVTDLYFYVNKNMADKNHKTGEEPRYIQEIEKTAKACNIRLHWRTLSKIESSLDLEKYKYVCKKYFYDNYENRTGYSDFYDYVYKQFTESPKSKLLSNVPLQQCYIEPTIFVDEKVQTVQEYLESWVDGEESIVVICGEPGHGKTSLCQKAMCDFYKKGWLARKVSNVFCFSLNPAMTDAIDGNSFNLYSLLSWGYNRKNKKNIMDERDCSDALIFFDGFDELIEWYPKFNLRYFIESEIVPFQEETGSHIIITTRNMVVDPNDEAYFIGHMWVSIRRMQLISEDQQIEWIRRYIEYCREHSSSKVEALEKYLYAYKEIKGREDLKEILGIPIIFRLIVDTQYLPTTEKSITQIYDRLFHATWIRHRKKHGTEIDENLTKEELQNHALRIFIDNNDTAETDVSIHSSWLFSFYTTYEGKKRVGFLHRSFYQYFLANKIFEWYRNIATNIEIEVATEKFKDNLSYLARRRLDRTTLSYIRELNCRFEDSESMDKAFCKAYEILKNTDGFIKGTSIDLEKIVTPLERANNVFWNTVSIGSICGTAVSTDYVNPYALRLFEIEECVLVNAQLCAVNLHCANLTGADMSGADISLANLSNADLSNANLSNADLSNADLSNADLSNADLSNADLSGVNIDYAKLDCTKLSN